MVYSDIGLSVPTIYMPNSSVDLRKWAVVACDQYTSQPKYWEEVENFVGDSPSTLRCILPEAYLGGPNEQKRFEEITDTMKSYLKQKVLVPQKPGFILVQRQISPSVVRSGLIASLDLEQYDFSVGSTSQIRATEATIIERIPPRMRIRENAVIELPHIFMLLDDPENSIIKSLDCNKLQKLYDFELMQNSGKIKGYLISEQMHIDSIVKRIRELNNPKHLEKRYGIDPSKCFLYAVGDGNHSFAAAKTWWNKIKSTISDPAVLANHPARFAMVEIVSLYDEGLNCEPIHRLCTACDPTKILQEMRTFFISQNAECSIMKFDTQHQMEAHYSSLKNQPQKHVFKLAFGPNWGLCVVSGSKTMLAVETIQQFIDQKAVKLCTVDYIHGEEALFELGKEPNNLGILLPEFPRDKLYEYVIKNGALPKKSFSLGEAHQKRFYLESKLIVQPSELA